MSEQKEVTIDAPNGKSAKYILFKLPYTQARKVAAYYPVSNLPKLGDYEKSEEGMRILMANVGVVLDNGEVQRLTTNALIDNHVTEAVIGIKLEAAALAAVYDRPVSGGRHHIHLGLTNVPEGLSGHAAEAILIALWGAGWRLEPLAVS